jgi:hypothetical protein
MRHLLRLLQSSELLIILPFVWIGLFSWPMLVDPEWLTCGEIYAYYGIVWFFIILTLSIMSVAYGRDSRDSGGES